MHTWVSCWGSLSSRLSGTLGALASFTRPRALKRVRDRALLPACGNCSVHREPASTLSSCTCLPQGTRRLRLRGRGQQICSRPRRPRRQRLPTGAVWGLQEAVGSATEACPLPGPMPPCHPQGGAAPGHSMGHLACPRFLPDLGSAHIGMKYAPQLPSWGQPAPSHITSPRPPTSGTPLR